MLHTRPYLSFAVGVVSRYTKKPTILHQQAVKHILRYLKGTMQFGLVYHRGSRDLTIIGYSDSDLADDIDDMRSTRGMSFYLNECLISWSSLKHKTMTLSSCEGEFMATIASACHALWLRSVMGELTGNKPEMVKLFVDRKSTIALMKYPVFHGRSKHIETKFHFIRDCVERGQIVVEFVRSEE